MPPELPRCRVPPIEPPCCCVPPPSELPCCCVPPSNIEPPCCRVPPIELPRCCVPPIGTSNCRAAVCLPSNRRAAVCPPNRRAEGHQEQAAAITPQGTPHRNCPRCAPEPPCLPCGCPPSNIELPCCRVPPEPPCCWPSETSSSNNTLKAPPIETALGVPPNRRACRVGTPHRNIELPCCRVPPEPNCRAEGHQGQAAAITPQGTPPEPNRRAAAYPPSEHRTAVLLRTPIEHRTAMLVAIRNKQQQ